MSPKTKAATAQHDVASVLAWLKKHSSKATRAGMARYGVPSDNALGVTMADMKVIAAEVGKNHQLAAELWETGIYEARMLTSFVADASLVSSAQMNRWAKDFDNWGICDTVCFHLFDRTPHAWAKVEQWHDRTEEFIKRAAFALIWGLTVHDKRADDAAFVDGLGYIERGATDERHWVKKGVNMALRAVGKRNAALNAAALATATRLAASVDATPRWIGKDAVRELTSAGVRRRLSK